MARSPEFARRLLALGRADGLRGMSAHGRLERHKEFICEAARCARDELPVRRASSPDARAAVLLAVGRAIAAGDRRLLERLHVRHPVIREHKLPSERRRLISRCESVLGRSRGSALGGVAGLGFLGGQKVGSGWGARSEVGGVVGPSGEAACPPGNPCSARRLRGRTCRSGGFKGRAGVASRLVADPQPSCGAADQRSTALGGIRATMRLR